MDVRFSITLPRQAYTVAVMRGFLGEAFRANGVQEECAFKLLLAASEACTNVIDHGAPALTYEVAAYLDDDSCVVEITHTGPEFTVSLAPPPGPDAESGRGIPLMRELVDEVVFTAAEAGPPSVLLRKRLHRAGQRRGRGGARANRAAVLC